MAGRRQVRLEKSPIWAPVGVNLPIDIRLVSLYPLPYRRTRGDTCEKKKMDMLQGMLDLLILRTLRQGELNGWDIMNRIQMVSGEVFRVIPGSLYPALHRLEAGGLVKAEWGASENNRRAKFYQLTSAGKKQLDEEWETWKRFSGAVELILRDA